MADTYFDATGTLTLNTVTPVIKALFGGFNLDPTYPGHGQVYVATIAECSDPSWDDLAEAIESLCQSMEIEFIQGEEDTNDLVFKIADKLGVPHPEHRLVPNEDTGPSLEEMTCLAMALDDGHGLQRMSYQGAWHCNRPRLHSFGGLTELVSRHQAVFTNTVVDHDNFLEVDKLLEQGEVKVVGQKIAAQFSQRLNAISDPVAREAVQQAVISELLKGSAFEAFWDELNDSVETLTQIGEVDGQQTLADLMYLLAATARNSYISFYPGQSKALEMVQALPSAERILPFIAVESD